MLLVCAGRCRLAVRPGLRGALACLVVILVLCLPAAGLGRATMWQASIGSPAKVVTVLGRAARSVGRVARFTQTARLGDPRIRGPRFGSAVAVSGDVAVVVAPTTGAGVAYVFVKPKGGWGRARLAARLTITGGHRGFFDSVAISGDTIVIGDPYRPVGASTAQGAVFMFVKPRSGWRDADQTAELTAGRRVCAFRSCSRDLR